MKRIAILLFITVVLGANAATITSTSTGGNWSSTGTWSGGVVPGSSDNAVIATSSGHSVTVNTTETVINVTVNSSATLTISATLNVTGLLTNNGGIGGGATMFFKGSGTIITGAGSWSSNTGYLDFEGANQTIDASVSISKSTGGIVLNTSGLAGNIIITNNGSIKLTDNNVGSITNNSSSYQTKWVNAANSYLQVAVNSFTAARDSLNASASGNTVAFGGNTYYTIKNPLNKTFYNLTIANSSSILTLPNNLNCYSATVNSGAELNMTSDSLFLNSSGTWSNSGTVINHSPLAVPDTSLIKTGSTITQKIPPVAYTITSTATGTNWQTTSCWTNELVPGGMDTVIIATTSGHTMTGFSNYAYNVTVNSGATLNGTLTIGGILVNSGTIATSATLTFTRNSGTVISGGGSWAGGNTNLYFQGTYQVIDASATNVSAIIVKLMTTALGGAVKVRNKGKVTLNSNSIGGVVNQGTTYQSVWINDTNAYLKVTALSFTNSKDTLYANAPGNTVEYGGNSAYTMKKPVNNAYYNLTISDTNTASLPGAITVKNNLQISIGTLDVTTNNYGLTIGGNFTDNGTFTHRDGTVTFNGSSGQTLGGSTATTFYNLTVNGGSSNVITLGQNQLVTQALTITTGSVNTSTYHIN